MPCEISKDLIFDCNNKPVKGSYNEIILIPKNDIDTVTHNTLQKVIVENITIKAGKRAYKYTGNGMPIDTAKTMINDEAGVRWNHQLPFTIEGNTPDIKEQLNNLAENTPLTIICKNYYKGDPTGKSVYEIFGLESPVYLTECTDEAGGMRYVCTFANKEGRESPNLPHNLFITNLATTEALIETLLVAVSG